MLWILREAISSFLLRSSFYVIGAIDKWLDRLYQWGRSASIALWIWTLSALHRHNFRRLIPQSHLQLLCHYTVSNFLTITVFYWSYHVTLKFDSMAHIRLHHVNSVRRFLYFLYFLLVFLLSIAKERTRRTVKLLVRRPELTLLKLHQVKVACWTGN